MPTTPSNNNTSLLIVKNNKKKLTKNQEAFNKLTVRIEKLQKEIEKKQLQFDAAIKIYATELYPERVKLLKHRKDMVLLLWKNYTDKKLAKPDQKYLKEIIREHLQALLTEMDEEADEKIKEIFNAVEGKDYDSTLENERELEKAEMIDFLKKSKVDLKGFDLSDEEVLLQKLEEAKQKVFAERTERTERLESFKQSQTVKKKSAKQLEAERIQQALAEMKQKNISTIYKQLAKLFHPDLEQDEKRKAEKSLLMQELIAAYEAKNLHALLRLELKWIHKENDHLESLTDEKLSIYLEILKEQIQDLQEQKEGIIYQPQYAVLAQEFGWEVQRFPMAIVHEQLIFAKQLTSDFRRSITDFKSELALRYIKQMIKAWRVEKRAEEEDEFIRSIFS
jgi:hypothetical protein